MATNKCSEKASRSGAPLKNPPTSNTTPSFFEGTTASPGNNSEAEISTLRGESIQVANKKTLWKFV
ncbi:MAG: hypothetical protein AMXMBFR44_6940 [Candidatus Campbellbacteria bacterium]